MKNKVFAGIILTTKGMTSKIVSLISVAWGWVIVVVATVFNLFLPIRDMFYVLFLLLAVDTIVGLLASKKNKKAFTSDKARGCFYKLFVYLVVLCLVFIAETVLVFDLTVKLLFGVGYAIELVSIAANLLILHPNMPFLRLISGALIGEIASKMNMGKDEVEDILNKKDEKEDKV